MDLITKRVKLKSITEDEKKVNELAKRFLRLMKKEV